MKKLLTLFTITAILLTTLATATVYESNYVYNGIIQADGTETDGTHGLKDVSVIGYTCQDQACETATRLWPATMSTGDNNIIVLSYPTELQSEHGYLVYFFKQDYVPYAVRADWYGEGNAGEYDNFLRKFETGSAQIKNLGISDTQIKKGEMITITADILSPSVYTKDWYVPNEVKTMLKDKVEVSLDIKDSSGKIQHIASKTYNMGWSTEEDILFSFNTKYYPGETGEYTLILSTEITDDKFLNSEIETQEIEIIVLAAGDDDDDDDDDNGDDDNGDNGDGDDENNISGRGFRNLIEDDTWEDDQYQNQFKNTNTPITNKDEVEISWFQKLANWLRDLFYKVFWFLED